MSTESKLPTLPEDIAAKLVTLRDSGTEEFYALVKALRLECWPLRAIGAPCGVSRTAVQGWEAKYSGTKLPTVPALPVQPVKDRKSDYKKIQLTEKEAETLRDLADKASHVRRFTGRNAPSRKAASELEALLIQYSERGVSRKQLADYCGVSDSSIKQRLRKHQQ
jgi:hypothetical protein